MKKPFGLDIGATTMKLVWLDQDKGGYVLLAADTASTPPKGMISESSLDQEEMARAIRAMMNEAKVTTDMVNVALPESQVYTKILEMPVLSDKELSSAIYWEAEQYIPIPLPQAMLDWKIMRKPEKAGDGSKMTVLLVGTPTSLIDKYDRIFSLAGLTINAVETQTLSVIRALTQSVTVPTLIINIGAASTSLAIVKDGALFFTYIVPAGGAAISRAIAADFGFTIAQAEEYKRTYGIAHDAVGAKISKAVEPILLSILGEVKKALAFYNEKNKETPVRQLLLSGGSSKLPGISVFLAENSGIETVVSNPWQILSNQQLPAQLSENAADYSIAVGLAMRDYE